MARAKDIPERDVRGVPFRKYYKPFLIAGRGHQGSTGYNAPTMARLERSVHCLSTIERACVLALMLNPSLYDFREQYPMYDTDRINALIAAGRKIRRSDIPTLDGVATLRLADGGLRHIGISVKPSKKLTSQTILKRLVREKVFCNELGWEWRLFTEHQVKENLVRLAKLLLTWANSHKTNDYEINVLSLFINRSRSGKNLKKILEHAAVRCGIEEESITATFAHAIFSGKISINENEPFGLLHPLVLA